MIESLNNHEKESLASGPITPQKRFLGMTSLLGSILVHLILLSIVLLILHWRVREGVPWGERRTDSIGIVFSTPQGYENPTGSGGTPDNQASTEEASQSESEESLSQEQFIESLLPAPLRVGVSGSAESAGLAPTGDSTSNEGIGGSGGAEGQSVGFADVRGNGRRFVYVLDRSESMKWSSGRPMQYAVREAQASIMSLDAKKGASKFQLVWFNHQANVFENAKLLDVTEPNKQRVYRFLASLVPDGATDPLQALELAIQLRPDVIFFLTDADEEIPPLTLARIRESRIKGGVRQIHVVEFGKRTNRPKVSFRQLADENQGQYIFKDLNDL